MSAGPILSGGIGDGPAAALRSIDTAALAGWASDALIASTLLMLVVLLVRAPVRRAFGAQVAYALWALPVLRLVLPSMPETWHAAATPITRAGETISVYMIAPAATVATTGTMTAAAAPDVMDPPFGAVLAGLFEGGLGSALGAAWAVGALGLLVWQLLQHRRFCRRMLDSADRLDDRDGVRVIATAAAPGPLAFGLVRRYVAFPRDFADRYDADECELALAHEIGHHQRGDLFANWVALVVLALHWFNPVAWHAFRRFRADQELANDARVLAGRSAVDRHIYACAIVKAAHGGAVSAACHLHTITDLKGRLRMLTTSRISRGRIATGAASVGLLVATGLALTASGTKAATAIRAGVEDRVAPVVPAAPLPPLPSMPVLTPVAPVAPVAPAAPLTARPADARQVTTIVTRDGKTVSTRVIRAKPGSTIVASGMVPEVTERTCVDGKDGPGKHYVIDRTEGGVRKMVICTNRIEQAAADAATAAINSREIEASAYASALASLKIARASIEKNADMTAAQRREALAGIDEGLAEVQADMAKRD